MGVNVEDLLISQPDTGEQALEICDMLVRSGAVDVVIVDSEASHQKFIKKFDLPFILIADTDQKVHHLYGTWQLKKNFGKEYMGTVRTTFIIDEQGAISTLIKKVDTKEHAEQILAHDD